MEFKTIEKLVTKYLEGETSLEEEAVLKAYFTKEQELPIAMGTTLLKHGLGTAAKSVTASLLFGVHLEKDNLHRHCFLP